MYQKPKQSAGTHRLFSISSITNQPSSYNNKYVPGAGVGGINISNRRAKLIHATPNSPFCNSESSTLGLYTNGGTSNAPLNSQYLSNTRYQSRISSNLFTFSMLK